MLVEGALVSLAYASVIVATLRAGSRGLYLAEHNTIGVMQGPLILGPDEVHNQSMVSPVWDLSHPFQVAVRLALSPESFQHYEVDHHDKTETYTMTPQPYPYPIVVANEGNECNDEDEIIEDHQQQNVDEEDDVQESDEHEVEPEQFVPKSRSGTLYSCYSRFVKVPSSQLTARIHHSLLPQITTVQRWAASQRQWVVWQGQSLKSHRLWMSLRNWISSQELQTSKTFTILNKIFLFKSAAVQEESTPLDDESDDWDYLVERKTLLSFNSSSGENITAHLSAHAPDTFADLRSWFGISEANFETSMLESGPFVSFQSNSKGAARIGGVFFFTQDGVYMIKSIKKAEAKTLLKMLPKYHKHMRQYGRKSLLTRFCGMFSVKLNFPSSGSIPGISTEKEHVFVIMNSVFPAEGSQFISERYDLKGSTVGRECSEEERAAKGRNAVLKDLDLAREVQLVRSFDGPSSQRERAGFGFQVGPSFKAALLSQLRRDVKLLVDCQVMDYSLLVGVVNMETSPLDASSLRAFDQSIAYERAAAGAAALLLGQDHLRPRQFQRRMNKLQSTVSTLFAPVRILSAPVSYFGFRAVALAESTLSSILTLPLPYYGAGLCGVDGGSLSRVQGLRSGKRALYYFGLIDFLQPWTARKVMERQLKGWMGYDVHAISCVAPEEYASRFLEFIDSHIS